MNLRQAVDTGMQAFEQAGITDGPVDARLLLEWVTGVTLTEYALNPFREMSGEEAQSYLQAVRRRCEKIPLQHITGEQEFMGLTFKVNEHVLIPRQDTELLVEEGLKRLKPGMKVLDLCTGSGCIGISLEKLGSKRGLTDDKSTFTGSDVSKDALEIAKENAKRLNAEVSFVESNLFENLPDRYDMILSNPPYIPTAVIEELEEEVKSHDPILALDGRKDGLHFYREITKSARDHLTDGGWLLFEIGYDQGEDVEMLMTGQGFADVRCLQDLAGLDRVILGKLYRDTRR